MKKSLGFCLLGAFLFGILGINELRADHVQGGEITWKCVDGKYQFKMILFRDCSGTAFLAETGVALSVKGLPPGITIPNYGTRIPMTLKQILDVTPQCGLPIGGPNPVNNCGPVRNKQVGGQPGAAEKFIYESVPIDFTGIPAPPPGGYTFHYEPPCCRNIPSNINCSNMSIRSKMFPYRPMGSPVPKNLSVCYDSSPQFTESPITLLVRSAVTDYTYNQNAFDQDRDSLVYGFDFAWNSYNVNCAYTGGYSVTNPIPGLKPGPQPNPKSGEISLTPHTKGKWTTVVRVDAYRCNQLVSSIYRDFQLYIVDPPAGYQENHAPSIRPPFGGGTAWDTSVYSGSLLNFEIFARDTDVIAVLGGEQDIQLFVHSQQFGKGFTDPNNGCGNPPCATLNSKKDGTGPDPKPQKNTEDTLGYGYVYKKEGSVWINWQTTCDNLAANECGFVNNTFTFIANARDNSCPAPNQTAKTITVKIIPPVLVPSPKVSCVSVLANGDVQLTWQKPLGPLVLFNAYEVFVSDKQYGTYTLLKTITDVNTLNFTHIGADAHNKRPLYYYVRTRSTCKDVAAFALDTVRPIQPMANYDFNTGEANVIWNAPLNPLPPSSHKIYKLYRQFPKGSAWVLLASQPGTNFVDSLKGACQDTAVYKVEIADSSGCVSVSALGYLVIRALQPSLAFTDQCAGTPVSFTASVQGGAPPITMTWSGGDGLSGSGTQLSHTYSQGGAHLVVLTVEDKSGCKNVLTDTIQIYDFISTQLGWDTLCTQRNVRFAPGLKPTKGPYQYEWVLDGVPVSTDSLFLHSFAQTGKYQLSLKVRDAFGCEGQENVPLNVLSCQSLGEYYFYIADAFSPNGDGVNDQLIPEASGAVEFQMLVFDRWGQQVYKSNEIEKGWDGTHQRSGERVSQGVYVYVISVLDNTGKTHAYQGAVQVLDTASQ